MGVPLERPNTITDLISLSSRVSSIERTLHRIEGEAIAPGTITGTQIQEGSIYAEHLDVDAITAGEIDVDELTANVITTISLTAEWITAVQIGVGEIKADHIDVDQIEARHLAAEIVAAEHIQAGAINAIHITAELISATDIIAEGTINNTHILDGVIEGVKLADGTVTARALHTNFLDARVSAQSYIEAESIKGGELQLGGAVTYQGGFASNNGDVIYPWGYSGNMSETDTPLISATDQRKFTIDWNDGVLRVDLEPESTFDMGDKILFLYNRQSSNRIKEMKFHLEASLPEGFSVELVNEADTILNSYIITGETTYETTGDTETELFDPPVAAVGLQIRATEAIPDIGLTPRFLEISKATFEFERGYGSLRVVDSSNRVRAEIASEYIQYNKVDGLDLNPSFIANEDGVWVPQDGLTIGSTNITGLSYKLRDFTANLVINPRFEVLKNVSDPADPNSLVQVPADWTFIDSNADVWSTDETHFGFDDILPQIQSLVSGHVLTMTLENGWGTTRKLKAISHKRYVQSTDDMLSVPISMSGYFRVAGTDKNDVKVSMEVYSSNSPSDITMEDDTQTDVLLGSVELTGAEITNLTVDGAVQFEQIFHSYELADGTAGNIMNLTDTTGSYIYIVLSAWCGTGTLNGEHIVEWDNIDCVISEINTPSDSQVEAELARRISKTSNLITYMLSGTKAVLPDLETGDFGLTMEAVW